MEFRRGVWTLNRQGQKNQKNSRKAAINNKGRKPRKAVTSKTKRKTHY